MRVTVGDIRLYFDVFGQEWVAAARGPERRPVVVVLHGGPGRDASSVRRGIWPNLADAAQLIVPDQRGHGRSDHAGPESWNLSRWAADVKDFCDALGIERPVVCGVSFGGFVAQAYAAAHPGHASALVLCATSSHSPALDGLEARFRAAGGEQAAQAARRAREVPSVESLADFARICRPLLSQRLADHPELAALPPALDTPAVELHFRRGEGRSFDLRPGLAGVRCPTLVLQGEHDPLFPPLFGEEIVAAMPPGVAQLVVVPGAAHALAFDNPEVVEAALRRFLADVGR